MKRCLVIIFTFLLIVTPVMGYAESREKYEEAYKLLVTASASVAAYSDRIGEMATRYLEQDGWKIDRYVQPQGHSGVRFLVAEKECGPDFWLYVVAIVGTETNGDIKADLKTDKVYFAGNNAQEFIENAARKDVPNMEPQVHKGFNEFIQVGPNAVLRNNQQAVFSFSGLFKENKNYKIILTGHSLGGAAATLAGARLLSMGVSPEKIEVITFGAPAVGNKAFATKFEPDLQLTRVVISGDPVTEVLQTMDRSYRQFGRKVKWESSAWADNPHEMTGYMDLALKNYYNMRQQAVVSGVQLPIQKGRSQKIKGQVYIAPIQNDLPDALVKEFRYMSEALKDEYRQTLPECIMADDDTTGKWRELAIAAGCRWAIVPEVSAVRLKQEKNVYYITLNQTVYDVPTGAVIDTSTFSTGTYNLTPLEAFIHVFKEMNAYQNKWIPNAY